MEFPDDLKDTINKQAKKIEPRKLATTPEDEYETTEPLSDREHLYLEVMLVSQDEETVDSNLLSWEVSSITPSEIQL